MDKLKLFVVWLDGYMEACGQQLNEEQTSVVKNKLDGLFEHVAEPVKEKITLEQLGDKHGFTVSTNGRHGFHRSDNGELYRC